MNLSTLELLPPCFALGALFIAWLIAEADRIAEEAHAAMMRRLWERMP